MWFTGRVNGAATVLVLEPSQVTGLPEEAGAFGAEVCAVDREPAPGLASEEPDEPEEFEEFEEPDASEDEGELELGDGAPEEALVEVLAPAPSSWAPVPSLHAVRESAARTVVAAAAARRVREMRWLDTWSYPFGVRVAVVIG